MSRTHHSQPLNLPDYSGKRTFNRIHKGWCGGGKNNPPTPKQLASRHERRVVAKREIDNG